MQFLQLNRKWQRISKERRQDNVRYSEYFKTFEKGTVNEHVAINNLSLKLEDGEFVTVVGSNGAGKSTLFNAICGSFMVDEGHIFLDDMDITYKSEHSRAKMIGRVFRIQ